MKTNNLTKKNNLISVSFDSTVLSAAAYSSRDRVLLVSFRNGSLYRFRKIPHLVAFSFMVANSPGRHFNQHIKSQYKGVKKG